jgi:hypothetical protein
MKPKQSQPATPEKVQERDFFQTPNYATDLLIPFLPKVAIWEPACGQGKIVYRLRNKGFDVRGTDLNNDLSQNFLSDYVPFQFDAIVTNPPFSLKRRFYERCIELKKPFALLIPVDFCGWILSAMQLGARWIIPTRRIDYITPTGRSGQNSNAQFHSGWITFGIDLPQQMTIIELTKLMKENI